MSGIGSAGGVGGPGGPRGPDRPGPDEPDDAVGDAGEAGGASRDDAVLDAGAARATDAAQGALSDDAIADLAADLEAGRITPDEAIDRLVEANLADLGPAEQTELRELLADALANDPYLAGLVRDLSGGA